MKVLIVDDEDLIREVVKEYCINEKYEVKEASDGEEALEIIKNEDFDCVVLDIMMPKMDGLTTLKEMRKIKSIPTIILSARGEEYDKLLGFDLGVDDYLTKPFSPKEFEILTYLIKNKNVAISRESLLESIWGYDFFGDDRTIDTHIKMLRNNLGKYRDIIHTVRGVGYKFEIKD